ncbi:rna-directed dna polymerase from mobile element jockey- hypothetical protein [Limosa lapponica baueri]|uniref:Rna-directed dna polymerase from mobile element jockey-like n=1 Tax=Limosa lapponica baueri TaxID=1758121 RepID=A0A2I0T7G3_LIMLA|nr:rna-directed dna polymerase from mobile element jockey- hypothetical protein [Limosa lapponica baueri]
MVRDLIQHLDIDKSMGLDGIHMRELEEVLTEPLSIIFQQSWQTGEAPVRKCDIHPEGGLEGGSRELQACQSDLGAWEGYKTFRSAIMRHMKDNQAIGPSKHGFLKGRSCLTNLSWTE